MIFHLIFSVIVIQFFTQYMLPYIEYRDSVNYIQLHDTILNRLPVKDCSSIIFVMLYTNIVLFVIDSWNRNQIHILVIGVYEYAIILVLKSFCMYICPLDIPENYISLQDPIITTICGSQKCYSRDLMFSGHFAVCIICYHHIVQFSGIVLSTIPVMAYCLMVTRQHYMIDIIVSFFVSYTVCHWIQT